MLFVRLEKRQRKYNKPETDIQRWRRGGNRNGTIEKAQMGMAETAMAIYGMQQQHWARQTSGAGTLPFDAVLISSSTPTSSQQIPKSTTPSVDVPSTAAKLPQGKPDKTSLGFIANSEPLLSAEEDSVVKLPVDPECMSSSMNFGKVSPNPALEPSISDPSKPLPQSETVGMATTEDLTRTNAPGSHPYVFGFATRLKNDLALALAVTLTLRARSAFI